jgi:hypothetical protein
MSLPDNKTLLSVDFKTFLQPQKKEIPKELEKLQFRYATINDTKEMARIINVTFF